jgi:hypothetical protein
VGFTLVDAVLLSVLVGDELAMGVTVGMTENDTDGDALTDALGVCVSVLINNVTVTLGCHAQ